MYDSTYDVYVVRGKTLQKILMGRGGGWDKGNMYQCITPLLDRKGLRVEC